tara:strand:- start:21182 stop:21565 length:384 start_codon:yes stop_codon:yes gene_type:complete
MNPELQALQQKLDFLVQTAPEEKIEFWFARDLQEPLGYARWENFLTAIRHATESCEATGYEVSDHFRGVTKMVTLGSRSQPEALPAEEDLKKLERRVKSQEKKLGRVAAKLPDTENTKNNTHNSLPD